MALPDTALDLSIIVPTFRREEQLLEALRSVQALQGLRFEVLVVDDSPEGSARAGVEALGDARISYRQRAVPTGGRPAVIRNEAARAARGRLLYFLDDDDRAIAPNLARACATLAAAPVDVLVSTPQPFGNSAERVAEEVQHFARSTAFPRRSQSPRGMAARLLFGPSPLVCSTCLVKATAFHAAGGFDESIPLYEDVEFYQRAIRSGGFVFQPEPILERRVGDVSLISQSTADRVAQSYRMAHAKYRARHGALEYWTLKVWVKLLQRIAPALA